MILLTSTSDLIQVITSTAALIKVHADFMDFSSPTTFTPGRTNTAIASAATTTVVASPGSSIQRNVKGLEITNIDPVLSCLVTIQHTDGTTPITLWDGVLTPASNTTGNSLFYTETGAWLNSSGPPIGPNVSAASMSVVVASDQTVPVSFNPATAASLLSSEAYQRVNSLWLLQTELMNYYQNQYPGGFLPIEIPNWLIGGVG